MRYVLLSLLIVAGSLTSVQMATNKRLAESVKSPVLAVCLALLVGSASLTIVLLSGWLGRGQISQAPRAPWWAWLGGLYVAYSVTVEVANAMQNGLGPLAGLIVASSLASAMVIDHFGWLGMRQESINGWKITGAILLVIGASLMQIRTR
jgi:transporter family-2 protein